LNLLTFDQIAALHYRERLVFDEELRNSDHRYAAYGYIDDQLVEALRRAISGAASNEELQVVVGPMIERHRMLGRHIEEPNFPGWRAIARILAMAELEFLKRVSERDEGNYTGTPSAISVHAAEQTQAKTVSLSGLFRDYIGELRKGGGGAEAERRWKSVFRSLGDFLSHDDASLVTRADIVSWKEKLLEKLSPKSVRDTNLAALRAVFRWAADSGKISSNPAASVTVKLPKKISGREKGFTDDEAIALLRACRGYEPARSKNPKTREGSELTAAKRWVPWLCAFTGARVAEMIQLRGQDVGEKAGIHFLRITPDAGSTKTGHYRDVPMHQQLLDLGFLDFVRGRGSGPLFFREGERSGREHPSKQVSKRLAVWIRSLDIVGVAVDPSHAWRHRFKTVSRNLGTDARVIDAIQGHAARTAGEDYGDFPLSAKLRAIKTFPHVAL
jgi:integrase